MTLVFCVQDGGQESPWLAEEDAAHATLPHTHSPDKIWAPQANQNSDDIASRPSARLNLILPTLFGLDALEGRDLDII